MMVTVTNDRVSDGGNDAVDGGFNVTMVVTSDRGDDGGKDSSDDCDDGSSNKVKYYESDDGLTGTSDRGYSEGDGDDGTHVDAVDNAGDDIRQSCPPHYLQ